MRLCVCVFRVARKRRWRSVSTSTASNFDSRSDLSNFFRLFVFSVRSLNVFSIVRVVLIVCVTLLFFLRYFVEIGQFVSICMLDLQRKIVSFYFLFDNQRKKIFCRSSKSSDPYVTFFLLLFIVTIRVAYSLFCVAQQQHNNQSDVWAMIEEMQPNGKLTVNYNSFLMFCHCCWTLRRPK